LYLVPAIHMALWQHIPAVSRVETVNGSAALVFWWSLSLGYSKIPGRLATPFFFLARVVTGESSSLRSRACKEPRRGRQVRWTWLLCRANHKTAHSYSGSGSTRINHPASTWFRPVSM